MAATETFWANGYFYEGTSQGSRHYRDLALISMSSKTWTFWCTPLDTGCLGDDSFDTGCLDSADARRVVQAIYLLTRNQGKST